MQQGGRRLVRNRRDLLRLAALGLGGIAVGCGGRGRREEQSERGAPVTGDGTSASPLPAAPEAGAASPGPGTAAARGEPACLVTKQQGIGPGYTPPDLAPVPIRISASNGVRVRQPVADAIVRLVDSAKEEGHTLFVLSGFRAYEEQERVFREEVRLVGRETAEKQVAPPGHSEHQLGLAVDLTTPKAPYELRPQFGQEPDGRWLAANAPRFGFVISYPQGKEPVTGYTYEPWHIRHVGTPLAEQVAASGLTLTEYLPKHNLAGGCP